MKSKLLLALAAFLAFAPIASAEEITLSPDLLAPTPFSKSFAEEKVVTSEVSPYVYSADLYAGYYSATVDGKAVSGPTLGIKATVGYDDLALPVIPTASVSVGIVPGVTIPAVLTTLEVGAEAPFTDNISVDAHVLAGALAEATSVKYVYGGGIGATYTLQDNTSVGLGLSGNMGDNVTSIAVKGRLHFTF